MPARSGAPPASSRPTAAFSESKSAGVAQRASSTWALSRDIPTVRPPSARHFGARSLRSANQHSAERAAATLASTSVTCAHGHRTTNTSCAAAAANGADIDPSEETAARTHQANVRFSASPRVTSRAPCSRNLTVTWVAREAGYLRDVVLHCCARPAPARVDLLDLHAARDGWPPAGAARLGPLTDQIDFQGEMNNCQVSQQLP